MAESRRTPRRDAVRNQEAVLRAATELFGRDGVAAVDVREIARAAGVGVGTVYRRFGDKGSLVAAVLGDRERMLQDALLSGPPPLGPGAPAHRRLIAFLHALADLVEESVDLLAISEGSAPGARFRVGAYGAWRLHLTVLLREIAPDIDQRWFADLLLAPLAADLFAHQRRDQGLSLQAIKENLAVAVERITTDAPSASAGGRPR